MIEAEKLKNVIYSPEFVSRLIHHFASGAQKINQEGVKFELIYFLLPLIMNGTYRESLSNVNVSSTFKKTILSKKNTTENIFLNSYIKETKHLTNYGIIYLNSYEPVKISSYLSLENVIDFKPEKSILNEYYRASYYLGLILSKEDYKSIFLKTKVSFI